MSQQNGVSLTTVGVIAGGGARLTLYFESNCDYKKKTGLKWMVFSKVCVRVCCGGGRGRSSFTGNDTPGDPVESFGFAPEKLLLVCFEVWGFLFPKARNQETTNSSPERPKFISTSTDRQGFLR